MTDDKPSPEEQEAAQALARALDGEGGPEVPDDALQAAALLRYSRDGGELAPERRAAILDDLLEASARRPAASAVSAWRRWLAPVGALATLGAAAALAVVLLPPGTSTPGAPTALPAPSASLLSAQMAAARSGAGDLGTLRAEMQAYRGEMYAALMANYDEEDSAR